LKGTFGVDEECGTNAEAPTPIVKTGDDHCELIF
jgi:hypothetical protein